MTPWEDEPDDARPKRKTLRPPRTQLSRRRADVPGSRRVRSHRDCSLPQALVPKGSVPTRMAIRMMANTWTKVRGCDPVGLLPAPQALTSGSPSVDEAHKQATACRRGPIDVSPTIQIKDELCLSIFRVNPLCRLIRVRASQFHNRGFWCWPTRGEPITGATFGV